MPDTATTSTAVWPAVWRRLGVLRWRLGGGTPSHRLGASIGAALLARGPVVASESFSPPRTSRILRAEGVGRGTRRRARHIVSVAPIALALVLATGCSLVRPSMAEVLDGQATAQARSAAIALVEQWPQSLDFPGASLVARQTWTACKEGQNNWKVKDGYRLKCAAHSTVFLAWDGEYAAGRDAILQAAASACAVTSGAYPQEQTPMTRGLLGPDYSCAAGLVGHSRILDGRRVVTPITPESWGLTIDDQRWVAGPQGNSLLGILRSNQWLFVMDVGSVFYQDAP